MNINIYKLDAFTDKLFSGNPAAVCILDEWIDEDIMQNIAAENNLAETAFLVQKDNLYEIRWFTPLVEVELCGHATLASAYVLIHEHMIAVTKVHFYSHLSGDLFVNKLDNGLLELDFPTDQYQECHLPEVIKNSLNIVPHECYKGKTDYLLVYGSQTDIETIFPDFKVLSNADGRGVIVTAEGKDCDFVSRFFAPQSGIDEDPVTGSAHTTLTPYWAKRLNKTKLEAVQLSKRTGYLTCTFQNERTLIAGSVVLYLTGKIITK
jgi:PhzF family phenazine biosynthesis protein